MNTLLRRALVLDQVAGSAINYRVVPTNRLPFLTESLGSVVRLADVDWSCVVVDYVSTDGKPDWLQSISDPRFAVVRSETRIERSAARNLGLSRVVSPFVLFLDDHDRLVPEALLVSSERSNERLDRSRWSGDDRVFDTHRRRRVAHQVSGHRGVWAEIMLGWVSITSQVATRADRVRGQEASTRSSTWQRTCFCGCIWLWWAIGPYPGQSCWKTEPMEGNGGRSTPSTSSAHSDGCSSKASRPRSC